jgi:hypothetical protein
MYDKMEHEYISQNISGFAVVFLSLMQTLSKSLHANDRDYLSLILSLKLTVNVVFVCLRIWQKYNSLNEH